MAQGRPYQAYQTTSIKTSGQKQLIVMLYEGMNRFMNKAITAIHENDFETAHHNMNRTGNILLELLSTLREDVGGEVAVNLKQLYVFCYEQTVLANLKKDVEMIKSVQGIINNLAEGWKQIGKKMNLPNGQATPTKIRITG